MTQVNLLELAKQGDVKAIASLINRSLQPKGITAKVNLTNFCLQVILESPQLPNQETLVEFIQKGVTGLGTSSIEKVKVYGRKTGEEFPAWSQEFVVGQQNSGTPHSTLEKLVTLTKSVPYKQLSLKERAKQGDLNAITELLNQSVKHKNVAVKANLQGDCLQLILESEEIPEETLATVVGKEIIMLKLASVKTVKIYGRQTQADFPDWTQEFDLRSHNGLNLFIAKPITQNSSPRELPDSSPSIPNLINAKLIGIIGCILLCTGIFSPIVHLPLIGDLNYLYIKGDSIIILILSIISLMIILQDRYQLLWITATASLGIIIIGLVNIQLLILQIRLGMEELLSPVMFRGFVDIAVNSIQIQWGWFFLFLGAVLMIAGTLVQEKVQINELGYIRYFSQIFDIKTSEKTYLFLALIFCGIVAIKMVFGQTNLLYTSSNNQSRLHLAKQAQAQDYIRSINLSQQIFYIEHKKFTPRLNELELAIPEETSNYKYSIINSDDSQTIATAIAKEDGLKSYLGAVFIVKSNHPEVSESKTMTKSISCVSNQPSKTPAEIRQILPHKIQCPADYSLLAHP